MFLLYFYYILSIILIIFYFLIVSMTILGFTGFEHNFFKLEPQPSNMK